MAVRSLGLGIGANTAIFSLVNAVVFQDSGLERPEELVDVYESIQGLSHGTLSYPNYLDFVEGSRDVFSEVGAFQYAFLQVDSEDGGVETTVAARARESSPCAPRNRGRRPTSRRAPRAWGCRPPA